MDPTLHPLLRALRELGLPIGDFALFGSGPLLARGWIEDAGDLDVLARGRAWDHAQALGSLTYLPEHGVSVVAIGAHITVGTRWAIGNVNADEVIDGAELIGGIPCAALRQVIAYKRVANRPKDRLHLEIIARHTGSQLRDGIA